MQTVEHNRAPVLVRPSWLRSGLLALCLITLWLILCRHLSGEWSINEQYNYGWFVPFFAIYLFYLRWEDRPERSQRADVRDRRSGYAIAGAIAIFALLSLFPLRLFEVGNPDWRPLGWIHTAIAVFLSFALLWRIGGKSWVAHFAFPLAFVFVAVPWISAIEQPVVQGLMRGVAAAAAETISLFGVPAQVQGNLIYLRNGVVGINEACSGVRSLQTSLMIGLLFGELKRLSWPLRFALIATALGIALLANFGRVLFLVWVAQQSLAASEHWHDTAGYIIVGLVFLGTMLVAALIGGRSVVSSPRSVADGETTDRETTGQQASFPIPISISTSSFLLSAFIYLLLVELGVEAWYRAHERNLPGAPPWSVRWPADAQNIPIEEDVKNTLRFDNAREVTWKQHAPPERYFLFFARWNPGGSSVLRARAHRPDICLPSQGWKPVAVGSTVNVDAGAGLVLPFRRVDFVTDDGRAVAHTFFCLQEDRRTKEARPDLELPPGIQPDWSFPARWQAVHDGVRNMGQQVLDVMIVTPGSRPMPTAEAEFARLLPQLIQPL